ncbi:MAG: hypothetical protein Q6373_006935 [Candidatus Sigynarchaeota archaeon]
MNVKARVFSVHGGELYAGNDVAEARRVYDALVAKHARENAKLMASRSGTTRTGTKRPKKRRAKRVLAVLFIDCEIAETLEG